MRLGWGRTRVRMAMCVGVLAALWAFPAAANAANVSVDATGRLIVTDTIGQTNKLVLSVIQQSISGGGTTPHYLVTDNATPPTSSDDQCGPSVGNTIECATNPGGPSTVTGWTVTTGPQATAHIAIRSITPPRNRR